MPRLAVSEVARYSLLRQTANRTKALATAGYVFSDGKINKTTELRTRNAWNRCWVLTTLQSAKTPNPTREIISAPPMIETNKADFVCVKPNCSACGGAMMNMSK